MYKLFGWVVALAMSALLSGPARAVTLTFNGPEGIGVLEDDALTSGLDIIIPGFLGEAAPILEIFSQNLDEGSVTPFPSTDNEPHFATSSWRMENASNFDLLGTVWLVFVTVDPFDTGERIIDYPDDRVGLVVEPEDGWSLIQATIPGNSLVGSDDDQNLYYLALDLGALGPGDVTDRFDVNYFVNRRLRRSGGTFVLPHLRIGMAFTPIPEPGTLGTLALGLIGLAAVGRRRR